MTAVAEEIERERIEALVASVERWLIADDHRQRVLAMDVLTHALTFTATADALVSWRGALYRRTLSPAANASVRALITYLLEERARGNEGATGAICDCLHALA